MKILGSIFYYLFILAVVLIVIGLVGTQAPILDGYQLRIVQSGSMEPELRTGSLILVESREQYGVGDVVTFGEERRGQVPITHRIVDDRLVEGDLRFVTKGDANENEDAALLDPGDILGAVRFHIPYLGFVIDFARTPLGFIGMVAIPAALVVFDEGMTIYREIRKKKLEEKPGESKEGDTHIT